MLLHCGIVYQGASDLIPSASGAGLFYWSSPRYFELWGLLHVIIQCDDPVSLRPSMEKAAHLLSER